ANAPSATPSTAAANAIAENPAAFTKASLSDHANIFADHTATDAILKPFLSECTRLAQRRDLGRREAEHVSEDSVGVGAEFRCDPGTPPEARMPRQARQNASTMRVPKTALPKMIAGGEI